MKFRERNDIRRRSRPFFPALAFTLILLLLGAGPAASAPYNWDGGHDIPGCPAPSKTVYFAEGSTRNGIEEYLIMRNPAAESSRVDIIYMFPSEAAVTRTVMLEPLEGRSINVNGVVGSGRDVSIVVSADPGIIAEREMYFNYMGVWTGGHASSGVPAPSNTWFFAEGSTRRGIQEWLCLQNPTAGDVSVVLTYMMGTGANRQQQLFIPSSSRKTIDVNSAVGGEQDVSILVEASSPIVAERPMYFDYKGVWRGGHVAVGSSELANTWSFAEGCTRGGIEEWLCIVNPGEETTATVEYMFPGEPPVVREYTLKSRTRTTIFVNREVGPDKDVSMRVTSAGEIVCERPMYFAYRHVWEGGHDVLGSTRGERTWQFPALCAGPGFESWLCLMNLEDETNSVSVEVMGDSGGYFRKDLEMAGRTRETMDLNAASSGITNPWVKVTGSGELMAERPAYFSYEPRVEPEPFGIATWRGLLIMSPIRYSDLLGPVFHEASGIGNDGSSSNVQVLQPMGICLRDDNPARLAPWITRSPGGSVAYFVESTRNRGTYSTTAIDVQSKVGATVFAPVSGVVTRAESYLLYGRYPDIMVRMSIDGYPGYNMAVLHMSHLFVSTGQRVEAGRTPIGAVRNLVPYFNSGPNPYTREEGNHAHIQLSYNPSGRGGEWAPAAGDPGYFGE